MIKHSDIHVGNWVLVDLEGKRQTRQVEQTSVERVGVKTGEKTGWFMPEELYPIDLTEEWLTHFGFNKEDSSDGSLVYRLGDTTFTCTYPDKNDKNHIVLDCHGSHHRVLKDGLYVHELQNHHHGMTKVYID